MCRPFNLRLTVLALGFAAFALCGAVAPSVAQTKMPAVPAADVVAEDLPDPAGQGMVFMELFTSENCPFCPEAERIFRDMIAQGGMTGFTCTVDYFSTGADPLARPFCAARQDFYRERMNSGPRYTPQLVLNGVSEVAGGKLENVAAAVKAAGQKPARILSVNPGDAPGSFQIVLPDMQGAETDKAAYILRVMVVKRVAEDGNGAHTNQAMKFVNGGDWDGRATLWPVTVPDDAGGDAMLAFVQDAQSGRIVAVAESDLTPLAAATP